MFAGYSVMNILGINFMSVLGVNGDMKTGISSFKTVWAWLSLVVFALFGASAVHAEQDAASEVRAVVEQNVAELLQEYERLRPIFEEDPDQFYQSMDAALSKIVDFRRIAARVMGKYAKKASKAQRGQFTQVFKDSLFNAYTKTLVDSSSFEMKVTKATINPRSDKRAKVDMDVISATGSVYPVSYSMYKNKEGAWLMENVVVFGVNVGLAFRDKFESQYRENKGNIASVIDNWNVDLEIKTKASSDVVATKES